MNKTAMLAGIPQRPGIYIMKDRDGEILYIGKAKNLKKRVSSYFHVRYAGAKTETLVGRIDRVETILTDNEVEALILENNLIKKHKPKFNIELKENENYPYIKITRETFPSIVKVRRRRNDSALYFGPYTSVKHVNRTIKTITEIFPIRRCGINLDRVSRSTPCLNFHIGKCAGPCCGKIDRDGYADIVDQVVLFLKGRSDQLLNHVKEEMKEASEQKNFERAIVLRERYRALVHLQSEQKITTPDDANEDFVGIGRGESIHVLTVLVKRKGSITGKRDFTLTGDSSDREIFTKYLIQAYDTYSDFPDTVYFPVDIEGRQALEAYLKNALGKTIRIRTPKRGTKSRLVHLASKNASHKLSETVRLPDPETALADLQKALSLKSVPRRIEAFDVATMEGHYSVASLVSFTDGMPDKSGYRRFRIRYSGGQNDIEMLKEAAARRYQRVLNEKSTLPGLVLVDGGAEQVRGVRKVLDELGLREVALAGLAKKHEEIHLPGGGRLRLQKRNDALRLLMAIRDEAHRFANTYHFTLRRREALRSRLEEIEGVGKKTADAVLTAVVSGIISLEAIESLPGIGKKRAARIYDVLTRLLKS